MRKTSEKGSMVIACAIITVLILAAVVQFVSWVNHSTRSTVRQVARQKALVNADSAVQAAMQFLRTPKVALLEPDIPYRLESISQGTTFYLMMTRQSADPSLVDIQTTGFYYLAGGPATDAAGREGQAASIRAQVQLRNVGDYFAAVPGTLEIGYGSDISSGMVYGRTINFQSGSGPRTQVKSASYVDAIGPANYANFVDFLMPGQPVKVAEPPNLPTLDASMRNQYLNMAGSDVLPAGTTFHGLINPPTGNPYKVYYSENDIHLGAPGSPLTAGGSFLIYCKGNIYIDNVIEGAGGQSTWPALMSEKDIIVSASAPDVMSIAATLVANGEIKAEGPARSLGELTVKGGIVAGNGINFGNVYKKKRNYSYQAPDTALPLPFTTVLTFYKVISGKFNQ